MNYKILPTREFEKDFRKLDNSEQKRIKKKIEEIVLNPERYKHLRLDLKNFCRIRIGKLKIIFSYDANKKELDAIQKIFF
jgi:mRNA-degrading endonuclease RelE of RelBE toxin-antitoxin system